MKRREFVTLLGLGGLAATTLHADEIPRDAAVIRVDPKPMFELSPWLYMQFMEPLGVTDSSVEASWDHEHDRWKSGLIDATRELAPGMVRWGGLLSAYYRWKEAVGPREKRVPMYNICWGGYETNQIGTAEFVDFCRQVGADPMMCVNFESEGDPRFFKTVKGDDRCGNDELIFFRG